MMSEGAHYFIVYHSVSHGCASISAIVYKDGFRTQLQYFLMKLSVLLCFIATQMILAQQSTTQQKTAKQAAKAAAQKAASKTNNQTAVQKAAARKAAAQKAASKTNNQTAVQKAAARKPAVQNAAARKAAAQKAASKTNNQTAVQKAAARKAAAQKAASKTNNQTAVQKAAARKPAVQNAAARKAAAKKAAAAKAAASKAAGKAAPVGVESSALPNGIKKIAQFPTSDFCKQFLGNGGKVEEADGIQRKDGGQTCSSTPLGLTPSVTKMLQTLITEPASAAVLDVGVDNKVAVKTNSLDSGFFNDPNTEYYLVPSTLNAQTAEIQGHQHITVQKLNSITAAPDPQVFAFFKGINDVEVDRALKKLNAVIPAGTIKEDGLYRICTLSGSDGHQGALSPVMERGSQDDCIRVTFKNSAKTSNNLIADDAAQNAAVTIDGVASNVVTQADNTGMDAGGQLFEDVAEAMLST
jgi:hypothetical protein